MFPKTDKAVVVRTDFDDQESWNAVCRMIRAPVHDGEHMFYAYVDFVEMREYGDLSVADLMAVVPQDYEYSFFLWLIVKLLQNRASRSLWWTSMNHGVVPSVRLQRKFRALRTISLLPTWGLKSLQRRSIKIAFFAAFRLDE